MAKPSMAFVMMGRLSVVVHTAIPPTEQEWGAWLDAVRATPIGPEGIRNLVYSLGGGPSASQRGGAIDLMKDHPHRTAIITTSAVVRGIVTAVSWFLKGMKVYPPSQFDRAFEFLEVGQDEREVVRSKIRGLCDALAIAYPSWKQTLAGDSIPSERGVRGP
jgi:hypothetical protein